MLSSESKRFMNECYRPDADLHDRRLSSTEIGNFPIERWRGRRFNRLWNTPPGTVTPAFSAQNRKVRRAGLGARITSDLFVNLPFQLYTTTWFTLKAALLQALAGWAPDGMYLELDSAVRRVVGESFGNGDRFDRC